MTTYLNDKINDKTGNTNMDEQKYNSTMTTTDKKVQPFVKYCSVTFEKYQNKIIT